MLFCKIDDYCARVGIAELLSDCSCVVVGFSGGADSAVLLSYMVELRKRHEGLRVVAAHVNHMIRGEEADRDEAFCRAACLSLGVELEVLRADIPALAAQRGKGTEETAREERYAFFDRLCKNDPKCLIATAHNADDNLETVVFHLARGSGTKGLSGIAPVREGRYIRPLLSCTSNEIREYAASQTLEYVVDSTNLDTLYTRNAIRHKLIPLLRELNPEVAEAGLRLSGSAREDCDYIEGEALRLIRRGITTKEARELHPALLARVIMLMYRQKANKSTDLSEKNVSDCRRLVGGLEGGRVSLPSKLAFYADKDRIYVAEDERYAKEKTENKGQRVLLEEGVAAELGEQLIVLCESDAQTCDIDENIYNLSLHITLDCDRINGNLFARHRLPGDTLRIHGVNRRLKKLMCDGCVPRRLRDLVPVFEDEDGIAAVGGIGERDGCRVSDKTEKTSHIYVYERSKI